MCFVLASADTSSFFLGEETIKITDSPAREYCQWQFGQKGSPHPAICPTCGRVVQPDRWDKTRFRLRKTNFDIGTTYDGGYIVSDRARDFLAGHTGGPSAFTELPTANGYSRWDIGSLPCLEVDPEASRVRRAMYCPACQHYAEVLLGLEPGSPPTALPLVFGRSPDSAVLYRTDIAFGSNHGQLPRLIMGEDFARELYVARLKGVYIVENVPCRAGRPVIRTF